MYYKRISFIIKRMHVDRRTSHIRK